MWRDSETTGDSAGLESLENLEISELSLAVSCFKAPR